MPARPGPPGPIQPSLYDQFVSTLDAPPPDRRAPRLLPGLIPPPPPLLHSAQTRLDGGERRDGPASRREGAQPPPCAQHLRGMPTFQGLARGGEPLRAGCRPRPRHRLAGWRDRRSGLGKVPDAENIRPVESHDALHPPRPIAHRTPRLGRLGPAPVRCHQRQGPKGLGHAPARNRGPLRRVHHPRAPHLDGRADRPEGQGLHRRPRPVLHASPPPRSAPPQRPRRPLRSAGARSPPRRLFRSQRLLRPPPAHTAVRCPTARCVRTTAWSAALTAMPMPPRGGKPPP
jgi:hypothetical protein